MGGEMGRVARPHGNGSITALIYTNCLGRHQFWQAQANKDSDGARAKGMHTAHVQLMDGALTHMAH